MRNRSWLLLFMLAVLVLLLVLLWVLAPETGTGEELVWHD